VVDAHQHNEADALASIPPYFHTLIKKLPLIIIKNKIDLLNLSPGISEEHGHSVIALSAKEHVGIDLLQGYLKKHMGFEA
ncbi:hypothetical protein OFN63_40010, partial [Escherichia coli]|nr:hypothetical protein [Escherichia coli]